MNYREIRDTSIHENQLKKTVAYIRERLGTETIFDIGIVLGSGLGDFYKELKNRVEISYGEIPFMPKVSVVGHAGKIIFGTIDAGGDSSKQINVFCFAGRTHSYEGGDWYEICFQVLLMKFLDIKYYIVTNATGGFKDGMKPGGNFCLLNDHIRFSGRQDPSQVILKKFNYFNHDQFVDQSNKESSYFWDIDLYNHVKQSINSEISRIEKDLNEKDLKVKIKEDLDDVEISPDHTVHSNENGNKKLTVFEGAYCWTCGPSFETPLEVRTLKSLNGSVVGMSTVPEVLLAKQLGIRVIGLSMVTNLGAGVLTDSVLSHDEVQEFAKLNMSTFIELVKTSIISIGQYDSKHTPVVKRSGLSALIEKEEKKDTVKLLDRLNNLLKVSLEQDGSVQIKKNKVKKTRKFGKIHGFNLSSTEDKNKLKPPKSSFLDSISDYSDDEGDTQDDIKLVVEREQKENESLMNNNSGSESSDSSSFDQFSFENHLPHAITASPYSLFDRMKIKEEIQHMKSNQVKKQLLNSMNSSTNNPSKKISSSGKPQSPQTQDNLISDLRDLIPSWLESDAQHQLTHIEESYKYICSKIIGNINIEEIMKKSCVISFEKSQVSQVKDIIKKSSNKIDLDVTVPFYEVPHFPLYHDVISFEEDDLTYFKDALLNIFVYSSSEEKQDSDYKFILFINIENISYEGSLNVQQSSFVSILLNKYFNIYNSVVFLPYIDETIYEYLEKKMHNQSISEKELNEKNIVYNDFIDYSSDTRPLTYLYDIAPERAAQQFNQTVVSDEEYARISDLLSIEEEKQTVSYMSFCGPSIPSVSEFSMAKKFGSTSIGTYPLHAIYTMKYMGISIVPVGLNCSIHPSKNTVPNKINNLLENYLFDKQVENMQKEVSFKLKEQKVSKSLKTSVEENSDLKNLLSKVAISKTHLKKNYYSLDMVVNASNFIKNKLKKETGLELINWRHSVLNYDLNVNGNDALFEDIKQNKNMKVLMSIKLSEIPHFQELYFGHEKQSASIHLVSLEGDSHYFWYLNDLCLSHELPYFVDYSFIIRVLKQLQVKKFIYLTKLYSSEELKKEYQSNATKICVVKDHVNMTGENSLIGHNIDQWGPRFNDLSNVHSKNLLQEILSSRDVTGQVDEQKIKSFIQDKQELIKLKDSENEYELLKLNCLFSNNSNIMYSRAVFGRMAEECDTKAITPFCCREILVTKHHYPDEKHHCVLMGPLVNKEDSEEAVGENVQKSLKLLSKLILQEDLFHFN